MLKKMPITQEKKRKMRQEYKKMRKKKLRQCESRKNMRKPMNK